jgi:hypothetical protein
MSNEYTIKNTTPAAQLEPVQPLAWFYRDNLGRPCSTTQKPFTRFKDMQPLYTHPAIPDAITDNSESPDYIQGWNDCRELTIKMRKP